MEKSILRILRALILLLILSSLVLAGTFAIKALSNWLQSPKEPKPAEVATIREVRSEDLLRYLESVAQQEEEAKKKKLENTSQSSLRYQEEATALFRCAAQFGAAVGAELVSPDDQVNAGRLQEIRVRIERYATSTPWHGDTWVQAAVGFTCNALKNERIIELRSQEKIKQVFFPVMAYHHQEWNKAHREKTEFDNAEKARVSKERAAEAAKVTALKALSVMQISIAGGAMATFILLALCLILIKIESNLRSIAEHSESIAKKQV